MLFDTHAHLEDERYLDDVDEVIKRSKAAGVSYILNVGFNLEHAQKSLELSQTYDFIYAAVGLHPHDAIDENNEFWNEIKKMTQNSKIVALGEMGLDYYWDHSPRDVQKDVFRSQINLARELKLPIIIHDRDAHSDVLEIVKEEKASEVGGVFHAFSGSWEMAKEVMKLGFHISIGGPVTFKNARKILEVAEKVPLDYLLLETDCPYLTPHPYRGKRNEPGYVRLVAEKIAELKDISFDIIAEETLKNGKKLFGIS